MKWDNTKNIFWINAVKAFCIIAVYFIHCQLYYGCWMQSVNNFIHPWYVNGFFFVSGYLLMRKQLSAPIINENASEYIMGGRSMMFNIFYRLAIPTVLFSLIEYFPKKILRGEPIMMHTFLSNTIGGGTYWFTSALVVSEVAILALLFTRCKRVWIYFICGLLMASLGWYLIQINFHLFGFGRDPWAYRRGLLAIAFLMAGGVYWKYELKIKLDNKFVLI